MKLWMLYAMALLYIAAGIYHFVRPQGYVKIMPPGLPWPLALVYISGVCEILLGALLFPENTRSIAAWGIIALLVAVFPANIQMTINYFHYNNAMKWFTVARLPLQFILIWWAWLYTR
jgi:uncharacterized membrane protein